MIYRILSITLLAWGTAFAKLESATITGATAPAAARSPERRRRRELAPIMKRRANYCCSCCSYLLPPVLKQHLGVLFFTNASGTLIH